MCIYRYTIRLLYIFLGTSPFKVVVGHEPNYNFNPSTSADDIDHGDTCVEQSDNEVSTKYCHK